MGFSLACKAQIYAMNCTKSPNQDLPFFYRSRRPYPTQRGGNSCSPRRRKTMASMESASSPRKVVVLLRATGDAPILKQTKFKMSGTDKFIKVIDYIRRSIQRDTLFVFVNSAFSPGPDETVIDLYNNFGIDGKLVVNYACSMAWG